MTDKYQDLDVLRIELDPEDRVLFASGELPGFYDIQCIDVGPFKDRICVMGIMQRASDDSYWSYQWSEHIENCGPKWDDHNMDSYMHRVNPVRRKPDGPIVDWVRAKA